MINRLIKSNENGLTLIELLATLVLLSIVSVLSYSIIFQGFNNFQRTKIETELRDEADLIMTNLVRDLFVLKASETTLNNSCSNGLNTSHINIIKKDPLNASNTTTYKTGFENSKIIVKGQQVKFYEENIELLPPTCSPSSPTSITKTEKGTGYIIKFTLKSKNSKKKLELQFVNTIQVIDDRKDNAVSSLN